MNRDLVLAQKRWMRLAMPDDVASITETLPLLYPNATEHQLAVALDYELRLLRWSQWNRSPGKKPKRPKILRPSKLAANTGYRRDSARKRDVRLKLSAERRREIARAGWKALQDAR